MTALMPNKGSVFYENTQQKWKKLANLPAGPRIIAGANRFWARGSAAGVMVTSDADFEGFKEVRVDGAVLQEEYCTVTEGSTVVALSPEYLEGLTDGVHMPEIVSQYGAAGMMFTLGARGTQVPKTGDNINLLLYGVLMLAALAGVMGTAVIGKRKRG